MTGFFLTPSCPHFSRMTATEWTYFAGRPSYDILPCPSDLCAPCRARVAHSVISESETRLIIDLGKGSIPTPYHVISCSCDVNRPGNRIFFLLKLKKKKLITGSCQRDIGPDHGEPPPSDLYPPVPPTSAQQCLLPVATVPPINASSPGLP